MFQVIKLEGQHWAVFLINKHASPDRYMLTSPLDKEKYAIQFKEEFERIARSWLVT